MSRTIHSHFRPTIVIAFALTALALPASAGAVTLSSTFTTNDEGWRVINNNTANPTAPVNPTFSTTGGNLGGHISVTDAAADATATSNGLYYQIVAPASWRTNLGTNYGGTFSVDYSEANGTFGPIVRIYGAGGAYLAAAFGLKSGWGPYKVPLLETAGWVLVTPDHPDYGVDPTRGEFQSIINGVTAITIEGDSVDGTGDIGRFDNVSIKESPDTDGDGVRDYADNCPSQAGPLSNHGCPPPPPDGDGDGVPNASDNCPTTSGPASNLGCPLPVATPTEPVVTDPVAADPVVVQEQTTATSSACPDAQDALAKAKSAVKKAQQALGAAKSKTQIASAARHLAKARQRLKAAKAAVAAACA